jgi:hypothetical protein
MAPKNAVLARLAALKDSIFAQGFAEWFAGWAVWDRDEFTE